MGRQGQGHEHHLALDEMSRVLTASRLLFLVTLLASCVCASGCEQDTAKKATAAPIAMAPAMEARAVDKPGAGRAAAFPSSPDEDAPTGDTNGPPSLWSWNLEHARASREKPASVSFVGPSLTGLVTCVYEAPTDSSAQTIECSLLNPGGRPDVHNRLWKKEIEHGGTRYDSASLTVASQGTQLFVVMYSRASSGGVAMALDFTDGDLLWSQRLEALGDIEHSEYNTEVRAGYTRLPGVEESALVVYGNESQGRYVEVFHPVMGHRIRHDKLPPLEPLLRPDPETEPWGLGVDGEASVSIKQGWGYYSLVEVGDKRLALRKFEGHRRELWGVGADGEDTENIRCFFEQGDAVFIALQSGHDVVLTVYAAEDGEKRASQVISNTSLELVCERGEDFATIYLERPAKQSDVEPDAKLPDGATLRVIREYDSRGNQVSDIRGIWSKTSK